MYCTFYVFVLCCTQADKASIVGESVDYIKALDDTLQGLERLKLRTEAWYEPNITMRMTGNESFISVCAPRLPGVVTKALCVLKKYLIDVVKLKILSCDQNRIIFFIDTCVSCLVLYCINYYLFQNQ
jgi:hypothetical protein